MRSNLCVDHWLLSDSLCKQKSHWIITFIGKINVWKCKIIFPTDTLQQKIKITDLKPFLAGENTSVIIILATTATDYIELLLLFLALDAILHNCVAYNNLSIME